MARKELVHITVIILALLVATNNLWAQEKIDIEGGAASSVIFDLLSTSDGEVIIEEGAPTTVNTPAAYLPQSSAVSALPQMEPQTKESQEAEASRPLATSEGTGALMQPAITATVETPRKRTEIIAYVVQEGDTISGIAKKFGISVNTILWENGLSAYSLIRPGQEISVLPVSGLTHEVKRNETLGAIAKKYQANEEDVINENKLADASQIKAGQILIVPNGKMPPPPQPTYSYTQKNTLLSKIFSSPPDSPITDPMAGQGHRFPWGQCTWYVAQKRYVPWRGDAKNWIANARNMGYKIGSTPVLGAIIATKENWYWGHVGYVEAVGPGTVTFSEMNYKGVGVYSKRTLSQNDSKIIGYIY
ncbi:LysM peptidoglycan-binding domain-containing protein [Candidatus Parcubacteria bacterium]|nr:LysM peptidoglycan-binding domain-containing protein [Candidatus Parcubacteria bacterium]